MTTSPSSWYLHHDLNLSSLRVLSDRQLSERAAWRASIEPSRRRNPR